MKRAFSFRNSEPEPPIEPFPADPEAPAEPHAPRRTLGKRLLRASSATWPSCPRAAASASSSSASSWSAAARSWRPCSSRPAPASASAPCWSTPAPSPSASWPRPWPSSSTCRWPTSATVQPEADAIAKIPEHVARELVAVPLRLERQHPRRRDRRPDARHAEAAAGRRPGSTSCRSSPRTPTWSGSSRVPTGPSAPSTTSCRPSRPPTPSARESAATAATPNGMAGADAEAPVVQVVNLIIAQALRDRASDIHIEPQDKQMRVRFRVDGALHDITNLPVEMGPAVISRIKIMADMNIVERRRPQDGQTRSRSTAAPSTSASPPPRRSSARRSSMRLLDKSRPLYTAPTSACRPPPTTRTASSSAPRSAWSSASARPAAARRRRSTPPSATSTRPSATS